MFRFKKSNYLYLKMEQSKRMFFLLRKCSLQPFKQKKKVHCNEGKGMICRLYLCYMRVTHTSAPYSPLVLAGTQVISSH